MLGCSSLPQLRLSGARAAESRHCTETTNINLLKADIKRAQDIRENIPAIQKDCDQFEQSLFPARSGYSSTSVLNSAPLPRKNGIRLDDLGFEGDEGLRTAE